MACKQLERSKIELTWVNHHHMLIVRVWQLSEECHVRGRHGRRPWSFNDICSEGSQFFVDAPSCRRIYLQKSLYFRMSCFSKLEFASYPLFWGLIASFFSFFSLISARLQKKREVLGNHPRGWPLTLVFGREDNPSSQWLPILSCEGTPCWAIEREKMEMVFKRRKSKKVGSGNCTSDLNESSCWIIQLLRKEVSVTVFSVTVAV